jgi:hypothetical protein
MPLFPDQDEEQNQHWDDSRSFQRMRAFICCELELVDILDTSAGLNINYRHIPSKD